MLIAFCYLLAAIVLVGWIHGIVVRWIWRHRAAWLARESAALWREREEQLDPRVMAQDALDAEGREELRLDVVDWFERLETIMAMREEHPKAWWLWR